MLFVWVIIIFFILLAILFYLMTRVYKVHPKPHKKDPSRYNIPHEEVRFPTLNNKRLYGWWIPQDAGQHKPVIILLHGWKRNLERVLPYIQTLHSEFSLLAFDARCHGRSDEDTYASMPRFTEDIIAAVDYVEKKKPGLPVGILGLSMGGAAAIFAASRDERIRAVTTVGAFAHPADVMRLEFKKHHMPYFPMVWLLFEYIQFVMQERFDDIAPEKNIAKAKASFLLIHGTMDQTAPVDQAERLFKASRNGQAELAVLEGMGHSDCHEFPGIDQRILHFFHKCLK